VSAPLHVVIVADGEVALRLYKRVGCAARALDVDLVIEEKRSYGETPRVFIEGTLLFEDLQRTEFIEARLADWRVANAR